MIALCLRSFRIFIGVNIIIMKYLIVLIACFVVFSMNSQVDRVLVNGNQANTTLKWLELESVIETLQDQVAALQTAQSSAFDGDYNKLTNQPALFDSTYNSLSGAPTLATVATSGSYTDLSNQLTQRDIVESAYNLSNADLSDADLYTANLSNADLAYAHLEGAYLSFANLSGANLFNAHLEGANLGFANLSNADLAYANLSGAVLVGVTWTGAYIEGCTGCTCTSGDDEYCD